MSANTRPPSRSTSTTGSRLRFGSETPIHVGSDFPGSHYRGANGRISNRTIHGRALDADQVD